MSTNISETHSMALNFLKNNQLDQAVHYLLQEIATNPSANAYNNLGVAYIQQKNFVAAKQAFLTAFNLEPLRKDLCNNLGNIYSQENNFKQAISFYNKAINIDVNYLEPYNNLAAVFLQQNEKVKAYQYLQQALQINPDNLLALNNFGKLAKHFGLFDQAEQALEKVVAAAPTHIDALNNLADLYRIKGKYAKTQEILEQSLQLNQDAYDTNYYLGLLHYNKGEHQQAETFLYKALNVNRPSLYELGILGNCQLAQAKWDLWQDTLNKAQEILHSDKSFEPVNPFLGQSLFPDLEQYAKITKLWGKIYDDQLSNNKFPRANYQHKKLKIGYLSPNFTLHPVGLQLNDLFKYHNRDLYEIYALPTRIYKTDLYYKICKSADHIMELHDYTFNEQADLIRKLEIDILIDLAGPTDNDSYYMLCKQPAPVQAHMLGATGTLGTSFIQYLITTKTIVPREYLKYYTDVPVCLPNTEIARTGFTIPDIKLSKSKWGLPDNAIIFLAHHTYYRIDKPCFDIWLNILKQVPKSVLWLKASSNPEFMINIKNYTAATGVDGDRIIFMQEPLLTEYWQHQLADLFLDTFRFSSGTCCFFTSWSGLPMITQLGNTPQARVGASFCNATTVTEQIVTCKEEYIQLAVNLAMDSEHRLAIKQKLLNNRHNMPLFDPKTHCQNLETAYQAIWKDFINGSTEKYIEI